LSDVDVVLTSGQVLNLVKRTTDENWFNAMMAQPDGQAILLAAAAMGSALSECLDEQVAACKISEAPTGSPGVCTLVIHRASTTATGTIRQGFKFVTNTGVELAVSTTVAVTAGQSTVTLPLQTLRQIDLANKRTSAFDDVLVEGDYLDDIIAPESIAVTNDTGGPLLGIGSDVFTYVSSSSIVGATMDWLSEHGNERGCRRQPGEEGEAYRARVRQIPDAVTPVAIQEAVHGAQAQSELPTAYMVEPFRDQASDTARANLSLLFADGPACDEGFSDDPFGKNVAGKLPLRTHEAPGLREGRAYFRESIVGPLIEPNGLVMHAGASYCDDPAWGYPDVGQHPYLTGGLRSIVEEARAKRAGGVQFDVMVENATIKTSPASVTITRYYLTATSGTGEYTGLLLGATNPTDEANAIDLTNGTEWLWFASPPGSPGMAAWPSGVLRAHIRIKMRNPQVGRTYKLYTGNGDIVYTDMVWDWTHSDVYQVRESAPAQPSITETFATLEFDIPVTALAAGPTGRLGLNLRMRVYVGDDESTFDSEDIVVRVGGDNASYIDTLFTAGTGWELSSGTGKAWLIRQGLVTCDVYKASAIDPAGDAFKVLITLEDATVLDSGWITDRAGLPLRQKELEAMGYFSQWVTKIEAQVSSSIGHTLNLIGTFWVTERTDP
jgi:hypothetical protein